MTDTVDSTDEVTDAMAKDVRAGMEHAQKIVAPLLDSVGKGPLKSGLYIAGAAAVLASTAGLLVGALSLVPSARKKMLLRMAQDMLVASQQATTNPDAATARPAKA